MATLPHNVASSPSRPVNTMNKRTGSGHEQLSGKIMILHRPQGHYFIWQLSGASPVHAHFTLSCHSEIQQTHQYFTWHHTCINAIKSICQTLPQLTQFVIFQQQSQGFTLPNTWTDPYPLLQDHWFDLHYWLPRLSFVLAFFMTITDVWWFSLQCNIKKNHLFFLLPTSCWCAPNQNLSSTTSKQLHNNLHNLYHNMQSITQQFWPALCMSQKLLLSCYILNSYDLQSVITVHSDSVTSQISITSFCLQAAQQQVQLFHHCPHMPSQHKQ